ncbi:MAG: beta-ketoacyl synthase N-terminal-like domain-containing protein, partial [Caldilinea sp.]
MTRCGDYLTHAHLSYADYVLLRENSGQWVDPVLRFHTSHGAAILQILPGYRPEDQENRGNGVLIAYDLHQRPGDPPSLGGAPAGTAPIDRFALQETVSGAVNRVLGKARGAHFGFQRPLMEMGLDSLELLELRVVLGQALHTELSPTFFFRYSTPEAIVRFFQEKQKRPAQVRSEEVREAEKLAPQQTDGSAGVPVEAHTDASPPLREAIAVIGMACRFPGGVTDGDSFWELMQNGVDAIGSIPAARWHLEEALRAAGEAGESASRYGGFLDEVDHFDAAFFRIAPVEAVALDPQ